MNDLLNTLETIDHHKLFISRSPHPFVYEKYKEYVATGQYPYLDSVSEYIQSFLPALSELQKTNLKSHCYYSSDNFRNEQLTSEREKLKDVGWNIFTLGICDSVVKTAYDAKKKILIYCHSEGFLGGCSKKEMKLRPFVNNKGESFLMKPKAKTRGWRAWQLAEPNKQLSLYKIVSK